MIYVLFKNDQVVEIVSERFVTDGFVTALLKNGTADQIKNFNSVEELKDFLIKNDLNQTVKQVESFIKDFYGGIENQINGWADQLQKKWGVPTDPMAAIDQLLDRAKTSGEAMLEELRKTVKGEKGEK